MYYDCAVAKNENFWRATGQSNLAHKLLAVTKLGFRTLTTALSQVEQSSILSAKFDCPVARQY